MVLESRRLYGIRFDGRQDRMDSLERARGYVEMHYAKPLRVREIAKVCRLSPGRLSHAFKERYDLGVIQYATRFRINKARDLLLNTDMSPTKICFRVGYSNQSHFIRTFKRLVGTTPACFRRLNCGAPGT